MKRFLSFLLIFSFVLEHTNSFAHFLSDWQNLHVSEIESLAFKYSKLPILTFSNQDNSKLNSNNEGAQDFESKSLKKIALINGGSPGMTPSVIDGMLDKFTGDFNYTIPLLDVDGYPLTLNYNSNVNMHTEASWVGLGWNLDIGSIKREMRGIPDEFNGSDEIEKVVKTNPNRLIGNKNGPFLGAGIESNGIGVGLQLSYLKGKYSDSYLGLGKTTDFGLQAQFSYSENFNVGVGFSKSYSKDTKRGIGSSYGVNLSGGAKYGERSDLKLNNYVGGGLSVGSSSHSRKGKTEFNLGLQAGRTRGGDFMGYGTQTSVPYGTLTSMPPIEISSFSTSNSTKFEAYLQFGFDILENLGLGIKIGYTNIDYSSSTNLLMNDRGFISQPCYGYLHSLKRSSHPEEEFKYPIMDFNRSSSHEFSSEMKNLPFSMQTFDIFNVSGMGQFRARREEAVNYYDPSALSELNPRDELTSVEKTKALKKFLNFIQNLRPDLTSVSIGGGIKNGLPAVTAGLEFGYQKGKSSYGNFLTSSNSIQSISKNEFDKGIYFKMIGEMTPESMSLKNRIGERNVASISINNVGGEIEASTVLNGSKNNIDVQNLLKFNKNDDNFPTETLIRVLTVNDIKDSDPNFYSYSGDLNNEIKTEIKRNDGYRKDNHISKIELTTSDGGRYEYGIPKYKIEHKETIFNIKANIFSNVQLIDYNEISGAVPSGRLKYFEESKMSAYPEEFLLTKMTSSDYVDRTFDGCTVDDIGSYINFKYTCFAQGSNSFNKKFPFTSNANALTIENSFAVSEDNMGYTTFDKEELWYIKTIESKNYIAEFILENRNDAMSIYSKLGQYDPQNCEKLLKKIILYNRTDKLKNANNAIPLKTIVFEYDYTLCGGFPKNLKLEGKLTLKKIYSFTGNSIEQALDQYIFNYDHNNNFNYNTTDFWGDLAINTRKFPYTPQDGSMNANAKVWKLNRIQLPSGGQIEVEYESDRYAFVQDKRAMSFASIKGFTDVLGAIGLTKNGAALNDAVTSDFNSGLGTSAIVKRFGNSNNTMAIYSELRSGQSPYCIGEGVRFRDNTTPNNFVVLELPKPIYSTDRRSARQDLIETYFKDNGEILNKLFFRYETQFSLTNSATDIVNFFAEIGDDYTNVFSSVANTGINAIDVIYDNGTNSAKYAIVHLKLLKTGSLKNGKEKPDGEDEDETGVAIHPLQRAALDHARKNIPSLVYGYDDKDPSMDIDKAVNRGRDLYQSMIYLDYAPKIIQGKAKIYCNGFKYGGGARVKSITFKDNWNKISSEIDNSYTINVTYEHDNVNPLFECSGVSSWEPNAALDENPHFDWLTYVNINKKFPDERNNSIAPIASILYPTPIVGYENVKCEFEKIYYGYSETKFETARTHPIYFEETEIDNSVVEKQYNPLTGKSIVRQGLSQGYYIETNDFHGKLQGMFLYDGNKNLISKTEYTYNTTNEIPTIDKTGSTSMKPVKMQFDAHFDSQKFEDESTFTNVGLEFTVYITVPPVIVPSPVLFRTKREQSFYGSVFVQHLNKECFITKTETTYLNSTTSAEHHFYDDLTGRSIVSSLTNQYNEHIYTYNFPGHWYYNMLGSSKVKVIPSDYMVFKNFNSKYNFQLKNTDNTFFEGLESGDLVQITNSIDGTTAVGHLIVLGTNKYQLMLQDGSIASAPIQGIIKLLKSIKMNVLNLDIQEIVSKSKWSLNGNKIVYPETKIIDVSSIRLRPKETYLCSSSTPPTNNLKYNEIELGATFNPYLNGLNSHLTLFTNLQWQGLRTSFITNNENSRNLGYFVDFIPYYTFNESKLQSLVDTKHPHYSPGEGYKWKSFDIVTKFDEFGRNVETYNNIGVFSSVVYGYNNKTKSLPVLEAYNSRLCNVAFDGFEDTFFEQDLDSKMGSTRLHFDFVGSGIKSTKASINTTERHSGLASLMLNANSEFTYTFETQKSDNCSKRFTKPNYDIRFNPKRSGNTEEPDQSGTSAQFMIGDKDPVIDPKPCLTCNDPDVCPDCGTERDIPYTYSIDKCNCIEGFYPTAGKYIVSFWMKKKQFDNDSSAYLLITRSDGKQYKLNRFNTVIDNWGRAEATIALPDNITVDVKLVNLGNQPIYFDDFRIHPYFAQVNSVVYDPKTLLPLASHDDYNFTTFYNYDENLNLVRIRVETVEGIKTVTEQEMGTFKSKN